MEKILSGKPVAKLIKAALTDLIAPSGFQPRMLLIQLGSDPAAAYYVQNIIGNGAKLGCQVELLSLPETTSQADLLARIAAANLDSAIHGIMIQKPLPAQIDDNAIGQAVAPDKDIDCLNPANLGKIVMELDGLLPCTPLAVLCALRYHQVPVQGAHALIIGRSAIVGKPLANMLLWKKPQGNASVTICHSRSKNLTELCQTADIVIAAIGKAGFVTADMIKPGAVLIDVGINEVSGPDGKPGYVGDVDFNSCQDKALAITPVPGGIGTITSALLFFNLVKAGLASRGINKSVDEFLGFIFNEKHNEIIHR